MKMVQLATNGYRRNAIVKENVLYMYMSTWVHGVDDNFIVNHDVHKGELVYVCLSEECSPQRSLITKLNGTNAVEENFSKELGVKSDLEAAQRVLEIYPHWVCCKNILYVFDTKTGMWSDEQNVFSVFLVN